MIRKLLESVRELTRTRGPQGAKAASAPDARERFSCACGITFRRQDDGDQQEISSVQDEGVHVAPVEAEVAK
jgi:hypothetical protein